MNRTELYNYIQNSILMGQVVSGLEILSDYNSGQIINLEYNYNRLGNGDELLRLLDNSVELNGLYFKIDSNDKIILTFCNSDCKILNLGDTVDIIGPCAFAWNRHIKKVVSVSVFSIGELAFESCAVAYAEFANLKVIDAYAFKNSSIRKINAPVLERINDYAFNDCKFLNSVNAPKLKYIFKGAFKGCTRLIETNFISMEYVGEGAFEGCTSLKRFYTAKLNSVHPLAFYGIETGKKYKIPKNLGLSSAEKVKILYRMLLCEFSK